MRVRVYNGDGTKFIGEGNYDEDVTVYFFEIEGGISSNKNAEEKPEGIPDDKIMTVPNNPKIILDNGKVVYGCQVWWEFIE